MTRRGNPVVVSLDRGDGRLPGCHRWRVDCRLCGWWSLHWSAPWIAADRGRIHAASRHRSPAVLPARPRRRNLKTT